MLFFPLPGTYAVVEIDVERTLQILDDPVANAAGAKIKTTKAIVYLDMILQLPFPDDETFKYMAYLIGPGLRPEHPELCITPDMCIPIYPNTQHPVEDREALKSEPPFPFDHCYHWFGPDMWLDLRIVNGGRDYSLGTHTILPPDQHVKMVGVQGRDIWRSICVQKERDDLTGTSAVPLVASESTQESQPPRTRSPSPARSISTSGTEPFKQDPVPSMSAAGSDCDGECEEHEQCGCYGGVSGECYSVSVSEDDGEDAPRFSVHPSSGGSCRSTQSLNELDIFGLDGDDQDDLLPIVKISLDLGAHLEGEDVPDPMAFMRQRDELVK
ncbi:hypothetical protein TRAPUB_734 [Trametes pubescens]|uniref:Uncharacterized protein n=1 Tax=Trametes pubescens TaxID=154538 RepID=A0A1M2VLC1_TRAPU|nr:hypothetical protein TRAPUB_734 [Trametes pubescens]